MRDKGAPQGGSAVGAAVGRQAPKAKHVAAQRNKQIARHITNYASNPQQHAKALRQLGLSEKQVQTVHRNQVTSVKGIVKNPKGVASSVVGFGSRLGKDLSDAAIYSPAGAYQVGKATYHDVGDTVHGKPTLKRTGAIGKQLGKGVASDFRHPGRHPGNVLLDLSAGLGAAEGLASRVAARSLRRPLTKAVEHTEGGLTVKTPASKRAGVAAIQRRTAGQGAKAVGKALTQERAVTEAVERAPMEELAHRSRHLSTPQQTALRVVNEGVGIPERRAFHERMRGEASKLGPGTVRHRQKALLLKAAQKYVTHDDRGVPMLKPIEHAASKREANQLQKLHDAQALLLKVAGKRETRLSLMGELGDGRIESRLHGPGQVIKSGEVARTPKSPTAGQLSLVEQGAKFTGGKARIPYTTETPPRALGTHSGFRGGIPRKPASVTHSFTGGLLKSGNFRDNTAQLVAESGLEAQRFTALHRLRDQVIAASRQVPREGDVAVRLDKMKGKPFSPDIKAVMRKREDGLKLTRDEKQTLTDAQNGVRDELFPKLDPHDHAKHPDVVWVDPKVLDGLDKAPFRLPHNKTVGTVDLINNAQKMAVLYLKPAYAIPNIAGNVFLNVAQQGPHVLETWWKSTSHAMEKRYGTDGMSVIDSVMGEGVARSLDTHTGIGQKAVSAAAGGWSKVVDRVFRRSAFLHEANRLGYKTDARVRALLTDEAHRPDLVEASQRAKEAIIDYDRMGPAEKEIVRRVIFFYPWVKGSTRYAGHFLVEHPIQSAVAGNLGEYGKEHTGLGPTPSYLEGSFKVGHNKLVNPAATAIFQTPAQVYNTLQAGLHGGINQANTPAAFATPAVDLLRAVAFRQDSFGNPIDPKTGALDIAKQSLVDSTPQASLYRRLTDKDKSKRLFPLSKKEAVAQFTIGGVAPKTYNPDVMHAQAEKEQMSLMSPTARVDHRYKAFHDQVEKATLAAAAHTGKTRADAERALKWTRGRLALRRERALARTKADANGPHKGKERYLADLSVLVAHKWVKPARAKELEKWAQTAKPDDITKSITWLTDHYFDANNELTATIKYLREHGDPSLTLKSLP